MLICSIPACRNSSTTMATVPKGTLLSARKKTDGSLSGAVLPRNRGPSMLMFTGSFPRNRRCPRSMLTTSLSWEISLTVRVCGTSRSIPDWRTGAVNMKIIRRTRSTSTKGVTLMSESEVLCSSLRVGKCHDRCLSDRNRMQRPARRVARIGYLLLELFPGFWARLFVASGIVSFRRI